MRNGVYRCWDNRLRSDVRITPLCVCAIQPDTVPTMVAITCTDGNQWTKLPLPDDEALPGSFTDESMLKWVFPEGQVLMRPITPADYAEVREEFPELPDTQDVQQIEDALLEKFFQDLV